MIQIDGNQLTIEQVATIARLGEEVEWPPVARQRMREAWRWVEDLVANDKAVYGINTGFGVFADQRISKKDSRALSRNLILSHAVATGPELSIEAVRAALLIRANTLRSVYSAA